MKSIKVFVPFFFIVLTAVGQNDDTSNQINTITGKVDLSKLGFTLTHEHIMSNYGKDINETSNYDTLKLFEQVIPYLKKLKSLGVHSIFDCTTAYFGRRVDLLQKISDSTGIQIITNTGFYGAANDRYIPEVAYDSSAESISEIWIAEFENGINDMKIKPGFVKLAFDDDKPLSNIDKKLFEAGLLTHLKTGLTLAVHTGKNIEAVKFQMELLEAYDVHPGAWIWTHANKMEEDEPLLEYAAKGAWISLDGIKAENIKEYINRIRLFKRKNLLNKVLLSHDGNSFPSGGEIRPFEAIFKHLIPAMRNNGFTEDDIDQLFMRNPREAFKVETKKK